MATVLEGPARAGDAGAGRGRARGRGRQLALAPRAAKDAALLAAAAAAARRGRRRSWPPTRATWRRPRAKGLTGAMLDRLELDPKRVEAMARGARDHGRRCDDPVGTELARWTPPERPRHRPRARAAGRGRDHLREPPQRHRRRRRLVPQGRQRRDPARRLGELPLLARDRRRPWRTGWPRPACPTAAIQLVPTADRAAVGHAPAHGRACRRDRAARRPLADRAGHGREPGPGPRPPRGQLPHLPARQRPTRRWRWRSRSTPSCAAPACAAPPRRCWSTATRPSACCRRCWTP